MSSTAPISRLSGCTRRNRRAATGNVMNPHRITIASVRRQKGAAMVEYAIVTGLVALVLIGKPSVVERLVQAIKQLYRAFTYAISQTIA